MNHFYFENPPLISTLMEVQFQPPQSYGPIHAQNVWALFQPEFPKVGMIPISPPLGEENDVLSRKGTAFEINPMMPMHPRYLFQPKDFSQETGGEVLQFEGDRFARSWQCDKAGRNDEYPRFISLRDNFRENLLKLQGFYEELEKLSENQNSAHKLVVTRAAIKYDNRIILEKEGQSVSDWVNNILLDDLEYESFLFNYTRRLELEFCDVARIKVQIGNVRSNNNKPALGLNIAVRANLNEMSIDSAMKFFDIAHTNIIGCFNQITTNQAQKKWGRK